MYNIQVPVQSLTYLIAWWPRATKTANQASDFGKVSSKSYLAGNYECYVLEMFYSELDCNSFMTSLHSNGLRLLYLQVFWQTPLC